MDFLVGLSVGILVVQFVLCVVTDILAISFEQCFAFLSLFSLVLRGSPVVYNDFHGIDSTMLS